ncbi:MAG: rod shape-determining protein [Candidatus Levybacteria bacterium RIFOXYA1_FULL_41_10]|nr:MAG: Rod shape-determining protein MreB [Candidatus Levybacteria bacterium GW2011_GWA1_39_34]KKR50780.1 MAG: Rod shape-determining protein MreB [Candidatus Levybacteria bacterium GW2011_GWC1_40_19]KKR93984.1 MAG: Rod shape-determining protein MreB [Candidatus Levybacteria bacterium GW2011_GWA2_41_15]OGH20394.1 MAG: rod shape-determining protein [Candidatus Levybacteria bacterium RIFCSPHIGHO2_01_FULL_40_83]OGH27628.1 MAG: rod shape-determining protein [Candidatus Levybacteria bacterium RIFCSP
MLDKFFSVFANDIGIDLGTANTLVWVRGKGIVIREPSVVALHKKTKKVIAIGTEAKKMLGKTPESIITVKPLQGGVISDFDVTLAMISEFIKSVHDLGTRLPARLSRPKVVIGIPSSITEVQRRAVWEAALSAGAREAFLIEEPMAAAIGEGISIFQPTGKMVVDIGGGTTEVAVISLGGIVVSRSLKLAGDDMDRAIGHYIRLKHGVLLGEKTIEELKIKLGSAYEGGGRRKKEETGKEPRKDDFTERLEKMAVVRGRDIETGLPKSLRITEIEVREALAPTIARIIEGIVDVLEESPPELTSDILEHGILLTGGGSLLYGLDSLIVERTHIPVIRAEDPLTTVVRGTGKVLEDEALLDRVKVIGGLK